MAIQTIRAGQPALEHDEQVAFFDYLRMHPPVGGLCVADYAWASQNGMYLGRGTPIQRASYIKKMKRAGFKVGVSDVTIAIPIGKLCGFYLELKRKMTLAEGLRSLSKDQKIFLCNMRNAGYFAGVALGADDAIAAFDWYKRGGSNWRLDLFAEQAKDGSLVPIQAKRRRQRTESKAA